MMGVDMHRALAVFVLSIACAAACPAIAQAPTSVVSKGQHPNIKLSHLVAGHLSELNGKYQLRVTEVTYDAGGFIGPHHHVGPGIRCVTSGELTYVMQDQPTTYRAGDCFFESGDMTHTARNDTGKPVVLLNFELLPGSLTGSSVIPVPDTK
jgi:quercetin dioxygenase-like cupin family protein